jgi:hypothetical protein
VLPLLLVGTIGYFAANAATRNDTVPPGCHELPVYLTTVQYIWLGTLIITVALTLLSRSRYYRLDCWCEAFPQLALALAGWPMIGSFIFSCLIWSRFSGDRYVACQPSTLASVVCLLSMGCEEM